MKKILLSIFFSGCAPQGMYYYGNYSRTLYNCEKNQTEEALIKHKAELVKIISESEVKKIPVPPGIYAELGYINLKEHKSQEAINFFQAEAQLYPESEHLMNRLIQQTKANTE